VAPYNQADLGRNSSVYNGFDIPLPMHHTQGVIVSRKRGQLDLLSQGMGNLALPAA
jgi:hypothetical protein